jgi:hypothetical protein
MLQLLITFDCDAEHDGCSLLKVLPEVRIFALRKQLLKDIHIGGGVEWFWHGLGKFVNLFEGGGNTLLELIVRLLGYCFGTLHGYLRF